MNLYELICRTERESHTLKTNLWLPKGTGWGGMDWECGIGIGSLLCPGWMAHRALLYSTGTSSQHAVETYKGKESEKNGCVYTYD